MKILFGSDMSFNYFAGFTSKEEAVKTMAQAAEYFAKADFSMLNLENVFGNPQDGAPIIKSGPNLLSEDQFIEYIHALKPSIVGMANNHSKDYGEGILFHTMEMLTESGYTCIGAGKNVEEAYEAAKISKNGIDVAIIAVCENEFGTADDDISGTAGYSLGRVTKAIYKAVKEGCKPIIYFHGGNERNPFPSPGKVELYRHFIDLGAEAVIAMHTHCPQGYEYYDGKPIVYSMGNFFFPSKRDQLAYQRAWNYGYLSELDITEEGSSLIIHPYRFDFKELTFLKGIEKEDFMRYVACISEPIANEKRIRQLFDGWCMVGHHYADTLKQYSEKLLVDGKSEESKHLRNVFACEAHNEVVKNTMLLAYESRIEEAKSDVEWIQKLQNMEGYCFLERT